jgi:hypothetical protein
MSGDKKFRVHPGAVVIGVCLMILGGLLLIRYLTPHRVEANVTLEERRRQAAEQRGAALPDLFDAKLPTGAAYATATRVTELSDFVLRVGIYRLHCEVAQRVPMTVDGLLAGMKAGGRLPSDSELSSYQGKVNTPYSTLFIRYRAVPFAVEVISVPRSEGKGNAMLMRLPANPDESMPPDAAARAELRRLIEGVVQDPRPFYAYFTSQQTTSAVVPPAAFIPAAQMLQFGWAKEALPKVTQLNEQQIADIKQWLKKSEQ